MFKIINTFKGIFSKKDKQQNNLNKKESSINKKKQTNCNTYQVKTLKPRYLEWLISQINPQYNSIETLNDFVQIQQPIIDFDFIHQNLQKNSFFKNLTWQEIKNLRQKIFYGKISQNKIVFKHNDQASSFYIIDKGQMSLEVNNKHIKIFTKGDLISFQPILFSRYRTGTLKAQEETYLYCFDNTIYLSLINRNRGQEEYVLSILIKNKNLLKGLSKYQKFMVLKNTKELPFLIDQKVSLNEDLLGKYLIIIQGVVQLYKLDILQKQFEQYEVIDLYDIIKQNYQEYYLITNKLSLTKILSKELVNDLIGDSIKNMQFKNKIQKILKQEQLFSALQNYQIKKITNHIQIAQIISKQKKYTLLEQKNSQPVNLYFPIEGSFYYGNKTYIPGSIFGLNFLQQNQNSQIIHKYQLYAKDLIYGYIEINLLLKLLDSQEKSIENVSLLNNQYEAFLLQYKDKQKQLKENNNNFELSKLQIIESKQKNSSEFLVKDKATKNMMQLKIVYKNSNNNQEYIQIIKEQEILSSLNAPFLPELQSIINTEEYSSYLIQHIPGESFFDVIRQIEVFDQEEIWFYIANIIIIIQQLHQQLIIHRDIQPDSFIVTEDGYLHLIKINTSKKLSNNYLWTNTIIGTPHYTAPEIIKGNSYDFSADFWSLGIIAYELACGEVPFGEQETDPFKVYQLILEGSLNFPGYMTQPKYKYLNNFIEQLLINIPELRTENDLDSIKAHGFFLDFNFEWLFFKQIMPPYKPPILKEIHAQKSFHNLSTLKTLDLLVSHNKSFVIQTNSKEKNS